MTLPVPRDPRVGSSVSSVIAVIVLVAVPEQVQSRARTDLDQRERFARARTAVPTRTPGDFLGVDGVTEIGGIAGDGGVAVGQRIVTAREQEIADRREQEVAGRPVLGRPGRQAEEFRVVGDSAGQSLAQRRGADAPVGEPLEVVGEVCAFYARSSK
jgi:hypothetical protein